VPMVGSVVFLAGSARLEPLRLVPRKWLKLGGMAEINHSDFRNFSPPRRFKYVEELERVLDQAKHGMRRVQDGRCLCGT